MPPRTWSDFIESHPQAHSVVAALPENPDAFPQQDVRHLLEVMKRAMGKLAVRGEYAATIVRSSQAVEILCAFERQEDADTLARLFHARRDDATGSGARHRFVLDSGAQDRLVEIAGPSSTVRKSRHLRPDTGTG